MSIQDLRTKAREKGFFISPKANKVDNFVARQIDRGFGAKTGSAGDRGAGGKKEN